MPLKVSVVRHSFALMVFGKLKSKLADAISTPLPDEYDLHVLNWLQGGEVTIHVKKTTTGLELKQKFIELTKVNYKPSQVELLFGDELNPHIDPSQQFRKAIMHRSQNGIVDPLHDDQTLEYRGIGPETYLGFRPTQSSPFVVNGQLMQAQ